MKSSLIKNLPIVGAILLVAFTVTVISVAIKDQDKCKLCHQGCNFLDLKKKQICDASCDATVCKEGVNS